MAAGALQCRCLLDVVAVGTPFLRHPKVNAKHARQSRYAPHIPRLGCGGSQGHFSSVFSDFLPEADTALMRERCLESSKFHRLTFSSASVRVSHRPNASKSRPSWR